MMRLRRLSNQIPILLYTNMISAHLYRILTRVHKAELLQLKPYPFICMKNVINEKVGNQKKLSPLLLHQF